jgi:hypothetical protein
MTPALCNGQLTVDQWQILYHEAMAALLRAREAVKRHVGIFGIATGLWRSARDLNVLNQSLKALSEIPDGILSEETILAQIAQVRKILNSIDDLLGTARRHGLMNRTLTGGSLRSIAGHSGYLKEYLDTLEMSIDPEVLKAIEEGKQQIAQGEYEILEPFV